MLSIRLAQKCQTHLHRAESGQWASWRLDLALGMGDNRDGSSRHHGGSETSSYMPDSGLLAVPHLLWQRHTNSGRSGGPQTSPCCLWPCPLGPLTPDSVAGQSAASYTPEFSGPFVPWEASWTSTESLIWLMGHTFDTPGLAIPVEINGLI